MPSASRTTTPIALDLDLIEGRYVELGDQTVAFETYRQRVDVELSRESFVQLRETLALAPGRQVFLRPRRVTRFSVPA